MPAKRAPSKPDFSLETAQGGCVAGIDEAGRGPWAGPVTAAAAVLDPEKLSSDVLDHLNDSKKLSRPKRRALFDALTTGQGIRFGIGLASVEDIDRLNIRQATYRAMRTAVDDLNITPDLVLVDGNRAPSFPCATETIVKGDSRSLSIAAASILAKETRDFLMEDLARQYPGYGWETNMGYGTAAHAEALKRLGPTPHHRQSFAPVRAAAAQHQLI